MTWEEMCEKEPRLKQLENDCIDYLDDHDNYDDRSHEWYRNFKQRMKLLVGWFAYNEELSSPACYDLAYKRLIDAMEV